MEWSWNQGGPWDGRSKSGKRSLRQNPCLSRLAGLTASQVLPTAPMTP